MAPARGAISDDTVPPVVVYSDLPMKLAVGVGLLAWLRTGPAVISTGVKGSA
ncbi:hypothetical protein [Haloarchaeobius sp. FL176]|uniref:hypothetical protein n=1 Tax=Haloarchaeobius sp. FL176 TaxID=2967129 RepID=UPI0021479110|nr:hypothetical protein [Haloarchaeobius sp. FL176]